MKILIIEDEAMAARRLERLLLEIEPNIKILSMLPSIEESLGFLSKNTVIDLIFSDIQLSDGLSFDIFKQITPPCPIIFTTAYDEYAIQAFKTHAVDYLLKPLDVKELELALQKFKDFYAEKPAQNALQQDFAALLQSLQKTATKTFRKRFLIKKGEDFISIDADEVAYFYSENRITKLYKPDGKWFLFDQTLDDLEKELDPTMFFRINRQFIAQIKSFKIF
jgi:two-component system, LytTR family, response regulator LytT